MAYPRSMVSLTGERRTPISAGPLSDFTLANGLHYRCTEDEMVYQLTYGDPDGDEISIALTFSAIMPPLATMIFLLER